MRGIKFKRQFGVGVYVLDFYAPSIKLAIELDGPIHLKKDNIEYDREREHGLEELDIRILRFKNEDLESDITEVLRKISKEIGKFEKN